MRTLHAYMMHIKNGMYPMLAYMIHISLFFERIKGKLALIHLGWSAFYLAPNTFFKISVTRAAGFSLIFFSSVAIR